MTHYGETLRNIHRIAKECGRDSKDIKLIAVSKNRPLQLIREVYQEGCRSFGENRVQDVLSKIELLSEDIQWHFIGTLQKNKVSKIIGKFHLIHSIDTPELAAVVSTHSQKAGIKTNVLLQVNVSGEQSKHGLSPEQWLESIEVVWNLQGLNVKGLMTMAPLTDDLDHIRRCFKQLRIFRDSLRDQYSVDLPELSMGMSNDYEIAIQEGATLVRIGTALFEEITIDKNGN